MPNTSQSLFLSNLANFLFGIGQTADPTLPSRFGGESGSLAQTLGQAGAGLSQSLAIQKQREKEQAKAGTLAKRKIFTDLISSGIEALGSMKGGGGGGMLSGLGGGGGSNFKIPSSFGGGRAGKNIPLSFGGGPLPGASKGTNVGTGGFFKNLFGGR